MGIIKKFRIKSFKQKKTILKLKNISLSFQKRQILENISFEINQGEIFGMLGFVFGIMGIVSFQTIKKL